MTFGSLFSGIGGMDLGLERAGMTCRWQVEIDPYARKVLELRWPDVPKWGDIREVQGDELPRVDLLAGGFPCQDISNLNINAKGLNGKRSGLWIEYRRLIKYIRPKVILIENTPGIRSRGLSTVLSDLDALGYDAEWHSIPASTFGAPHPRDRVWIVAYPNGERLETCVLAGDFRESQRSKTREELELTRTGYGAFPAWNAPEPNVGRVAHGVPDRIHRLKGLGNGQVVQVVEWIGRRIMEVYT